MTPMLQALMRDALLPEAKRRLVYRHGLKGPPRRPESFGAFDVSSILDLARRACAAMAEKRMAQDQTAFLPFESTWIEFADTDDAGQRVHVAWHLERFEVPLPNESGASLVSYVWSPNGGWVSGGVMPFALPLRGSAWLGQGIPTRLDYSLSDDAQRASSFLYALLAMINSPRALARREHAPHKGLDRDLRRTGQPGLRPWTEILLELPGGRRIERDDAAPPAEGRGGAKAEHWVRMHPRFKLGRVEWVTAHKRGDPALGTVQATYRVRPQPGQQPSDET